MILWSDTTVTLMTVFVIAALGFALGRVQVGGIRLGTAAVFLVGLVFGHFGAELPPVLQTLGLVLFITALGFSVGPSFLRRMRKNGLQYAALCVSTALVGSLVCLGIIRLGGIDAPLAVGIMTGAFTTSPGFAAAREAVSGEAGARLAAGYGLVYPIGVICKVLFIQLVPRLLHADMAKERALIAMPLQESEEKKAEKILHIDKLGFFALSLAAGIGILIGSLSLPLPGGGRFSLGATGGPLLVGLIFGALGRAGRLGLSVDSGIIAPTKELGLLLFFACAGVEGGQGLQSVLAEYGAIPLLYGFLLVSVSLLGGYLMFRYVLRLPLLNGLGAMTASMTCTPSLAVLTQLAETDDVAAAYATTYPIALVTLITVVQFLICKVSH